MPKVLVVEDDPYVFELYKRLFDLKDFSTDVAKNGKEGVEKAKSFKPDIILMDIMMPVMDGIESLKRIKSDDETKHIPIIMLTNLDDQISYETAINNGADSFMIKSDFTPRQVLDKCKQLLAVK